MNTLVIIFSYNRSAPLLKTLKELHGHYPIVVIDDGSEYDYSEHEKYCNYIRCPHTGKHNFWLKWNMAFKICESSEYSRFVFLPDDWKNYDIERINSTFDLFGDEFACNVGNVGWEISWTPIRKEISDVDGFFRVGWCDQGTITTRTVLEKLKFDVYPIKESHFETNGSSGTGKQISTRLYNLGIPMYMPDKSMAKDQDVESQMHKQERETNPLKLL